MPGVFGLQPSANPSTSRPSLTSDILEASAAVTCQARSLRKLRAGKRGDWATTPREAESARSLKPSPPAAIRSRGRRSAYPAIGFLQHYRQATKRPCTCATLAEVPSAIRISSGPMIFCRTFSSSHDFPAPASAGIIRCGRHASAPPAIAAAIQPRKSLAVLFAVPAVGKDQPRPPPESLCR